MKVAGANFPPRKPIRRAVEMMMGKGALRKKMAMKEAAAMTHMMGFFRMREAMRWMAMATMAMTAALMPSKAAMKMGRVPQVT